MSDTNDVNALEQDVEEARQRLASTINRIASPETIDHAKSELMTYAQGAKDEINDYVSKKKDEVGEYVTKAKDDAFDRVRDTAQQKVQSFTEELKERARANPVAVGLIGAGIAWRLWKHPPITTILVGSGVALLMSGPKSRSHGSAYSDPYDEDRPSTYVPGGIAGFGYPANSDGQGEGFLQQAAGAAARTGEAAQELAARARQAARDAAGRVSEVAAGVAGRVSDVAGERASRVSQSAADAAGRVGQLSAEGADEVSEAWTETADRLGHATGDGRARLSDAGFRAAGSLNTVAEEIADNANRFAQQASRSPVLLGALGVAVGFGLWRVAGRTEAGGRFIDSAGRSMARHTREFNDAAARATRSAGARVGDLASTARETVGSGVSQVVGTVGELPASLSRVAAEVTSAATDAFGSMAGSFRTASPGDAAQGSRRGSHDGARHGGEDAGPPLAQWFGEEVLALPQRYPLLFTAIGLSVGAALGGSVRLTETERRVAGPLSAVAKRRLTEIADEGYEGVLTAAEKVKEDFKTRLTEKHDSKSPDTATAPSGGRPPFPESHQGSSSGAGLSPAGGPPARPAGVAPPRPAGGLGSL